MIVVGVVILVALIGAVLWYSTAQRS